MILEGDVSVKAALLGGKRTVQKVMLDEKRRDRNAAFILRVCEQNGIDVVRCSRSDVDAAASGRTHGGMIAEVCARNYDRTEDCLSPDVPFVVLLEGVEDPYNLGYVMRTLYSAGCTGLILKQRSWEHAEPVIVKSSAGASEYLTTVSSEDPVKDIRWLKEQGLFCYAAMRKDASVYYDGDYRIPMILMIGGEMRGLSSAVLELSDRNVYIPYMNDFRNALNAASACSALAFEVVRQRLYPR